MCAILYIYGGKKHRAGRASSGLGSFSSVSGTGFLVTVLVCMCRLVVGWLQLRTRQGHTHVAPSGSFDHVTNGLCFGRSIDLGPLDSNVSALFWVYGACRGGAVKALFKMSLLKRIERDAACVRCCACAEAGPPESHRAPNPTRPRHTRIPCQCVTSASSYRAAAALLWAVDQATR